MSGLDVGDEYVDTIEKERWILMIFVDGKLAEKERISDKDEAIESYYERLDEHFNALGEINIVLEKRKPERLV